MVETLLHRLFSRVGGPRGERRRERREEPADATVEIDGRSYPVKDWSSTGFRLRDWSGGRREGDRVNVRFSVGLPEGRLEFSCQAIVLRVDERRRELAGAFVMLDPEARVAVARHFG